MLANETSEDARARLRLALTHDEATIRAVAARVAGTMALDGSAPVLSAALGKETDAAAAAEQIRALLLVLGPAAGPVIEPQLARAGRTGPRLAAEWLGRMQPERFAERLESLLGLQPDDGSFLATTVRMAAEQHPEVRTRLFREWLRIAPDAEWRHFLEGLRVVPATDVAVIREALASSKGGIRRETVWSLVTALAWQPTISTELLDAALPSADSIDTPSWETFGRELVARRHRRAHAVDRSTLILAEGAQHRLDLTGVASLSDLTPGERRAGAAILGKPMRRTGGPDFRDGVKAPGEIIPMRTIPAPRPGLLRTILDSSGCSSAKPGVAGAVRLSYRPDGAPQRVEVDEQSLPGCRPALTALARLSIADRDHPVINGGTEWLLMPLEPAFVECADRPISDALPVGLQHDGRQIDTPHKIRDVRPEYSRVAVENGIQGTVVLSALVTESGCVSSARVVRSLAPSLDFSALRAVIGWRFDPARLDEKPVAVSVTVTVNFSLR